MPLCHNVHNECIQHALRITYKMCIEIFINTKNNDNLFEDFKYDNKKCVYYNKLYYNLYYIGLKNITTLAITL